MKLATEHQFTALVGIDWADRKHDFCLQATGSDRRESGVLVHNPESIAQWASGLHRRFGGPIAVCLEIAKGPLVHALQRHDFLVLFPVNPAMLAKYREAFVPSRAKDDPTDAEIALELLLWIGTSFRHFSRKVLICELWQRWSSNDAASLAIRLASPFD